MHHRAAHGARELGSGTRSRGRAMCRSRRTGPHRSRSCGSSGEGLAARSSDLRGWLDFSDRRDSRSRGSRRFVTLRGCRRGCTRAILHPWRPSPQRPGLPEVSRFEGLRVETFMTGHSLTRHTFRKAILGAAVLPFSRAGRLKHRSLESKHPFPEQPSACPSSIGS